LTPVFTGVILDAVWTRPVGTGSVYRASGSLGTHVRGPLIRVVRRCLCTPVNTARGHGCSVHTTRVHGPCSRTELTGARARTLFLGPTGVHNPDDGIWIGLTLFGGITIFTDRPTEHATPSVTVGGMMGPHRSTMYVDVVFTDIQLTGAREHECLKGHPCWTPVFTVRKHG